MAAETGSGSSRSHFCSIFYHLRSSDRRLRLAVCSQSFLSSFSVDRHYKFHNWKSSYLGNVAREVTYELGEMD